MNDLTLSAEIDLQAADGKQPRVEILAYGGDVMRVPGYGAVVVDLSGLDTSATVALLADHKNELNTVVGQGEASVNNNQLFVVGTLTTATPAGAQVLAMHRDGFKFQASIGTAVITTRPIKAGATIRVNGRTITATAGGFTLVEKSKLREVTVCALGCDDGTSVFIAAKKEGLKSMNDTQELLASERTRLTSIDAVFSGAAYLRDAMQHRFDELKASAISEGWDTTRTESELFKLSKDSNTITQLRASYPTGPSIRGNGNHANDKNILEAALMLHMGHHTLAEKAYGEHIAQRAEDMGINSMVDLCRASLASAGIERPMGRDEMIRASFTTTSLPGILGNAANKLLMNSYTAFPSVARVVARKLTANDFKQATGYRLSAASTFLQIGPTGEIKHGELNQSSFTYKIDTYGRMFGINRQNVINDDLGAFDTIPQQIGRGAAEAVEDAFWTLVLANTGNFFSTANGNYFEGAATNLQASSLASAVEKMLKMTDENGKPISVIPQWLVVPPELKTTGDELYVSRTLNVGGGSTSTDNKLPAENAMFGKYQPLPTPYLSNASYSGHSASAWYLFGNRDDVAAFGIAYLNGNENPTVETSQADFDTLGLQMRGYLDFGVCQIDKRGAVKSKGAA